MILKRRKRIQSTWWRNTNEIGVHRHKHCHRPFGKKNRILRRSRYTFFAFRYQWTKTGYFGLIISEYKLHKLKTPKEAKEILRKFKLLVHILSLNDKIITLALNDNDFQDFEDGLQYYTAIKNRIDTIITQKKIKNAEIPIATAKKYLAKPLTW